MKKMFVTLALAGLAVGTAFGQAVIDPELKAAFANGAPVQQVVVSFKGSGAPSLTQVALLRSLGITKGLTMQALPIAGVLATSAQVQALASNPEVRSVFVNKRLEYYNYHDTNLTGVKRLRADQTITARNNGTPVSGRGIGVLINDSGVDGTHDDIKLGSHLVQNTLGQTNLNNLSALLPVTYIENVPNTDNNSGHGTHCAGTVGGNGAKSSGKYEGVAPGASLLGYGSGAALLVLDAIGGFDYALTHQYQYNIRVVSNSFGSSGAFDPEAPINIVTKKVYDRGMVVVFAAGNEGPSSDTHNPYAIAPWTISVGAGDRAGQLASFSSRGVKGQGGTFVVDGQTWTYKNEPSIVAPGVDVVSTRVLGPVATLGIQEDATSGELATNEIPFYTHMSGTSMATPHLAGICALILEAKPSLTPAQVKALLQKTATNMPGRESWEVGSGYVNAYAAVDQALRNPGFGTSVSAARTFNASVNSVSTVTPFQVSYNPVLTAANSFTFQVASGANSLEAKITSAGLEGITGNPTNLILIDPNGVQYRSGTPVTFTLSPDRGVAVTSPVAGTWTLKIDGLRGVALPEDISGNLTVQTNTGTTNLNDIAGAPSEAAIKLAISRRLVDGLPTGYKPYQNLTRLQLADYLLMGQGIRQYLPTDGTRNFQDVSSPADVLLAEATTAKGAALRDRFHQYKGVMQPTAAGTFDPQASVRRDALAYSLVQSLGFQAQAEARNGQPVTVTVNGQTLPLDDARDITPGLEGYVSIALELNLINGFYSVTQGPYDLQPTLHVAFQPYRTVSRGEFAIIITRTFAQYDALTQPAATAARTSSAPAASLVAAGPNATAGSQEVAAYPNPCVSTATISYFVAQDGPVSVEVFTPLGRKVRTLVHAAEAAGNHEVSLDASSLAQGTYLFTVKTGATTTTKRLVVQ